MTNKLLLRVAFVVSQLVIAALPSFAFEVRGLNYEILSETDKTVKLVQSSDATGIVIIPSSVEYNDETYTVTSMEGMAFTHCKGLTSVILPNTMTSIGMYAFYMCKELNSVTIPNSVEVIDEEAFCCCSGLTAVEIPCSVTKIGRSAFYGCSNMISVNLPNSLNEIGANAFSGCSALTSVTIPESITSINGGIFEKCSSLSSVTIPESVITIGMSAFADCESLVSVSIPESVTTIGEQAFRSCTRLTSIVIPKLITSIPRYAFQGCINLTTVILPETITWISEYAFTCTKPSTFYCYSTNPTECSEYAFNNTMAKSSTLYVPKGTKGVYHKVKPWYYFANIVEMGTEIAAPTIEFSDGKLLFACETEGAEIHTTIKSDDWFTDQTVTGNELELSGCYEINSYATARGLSQSPITTAYLYWIKPSDNSNSSPNVIETGFNRGIIVSTSDGTIRISNLTDDEEVNFYSINGILFGTTKAQHGRAEFRAEAGTIVIARIADSSIKIVVR